MVGNLLRINILFSLLTMCFLANAQIVVSGVVKDFDNRTPIDSAHIMIDILNGSVTIEGYTNAKGEYIIRIPQNIQKGNYPIRIRKKGIYDLNGIVYLSDGAVRDFFLRYRIMPEYVPKGSPPPLPVVKEEPVKPEEKPQTAESKPKVEEEKPKAEEVKPVAEIPKKPVVPSLEGYATNNLVLLIDVSGSMQDSTKLPLLKSSLQYLLGLFRPTDQIAIVTYSDKATIVLPPTRASRMDTIKQVVNGLHAKGKSLGGDGLEEAYNLAKQNFVTKGNNRIILATDGIFSSVDLEEKRMLKLIRNGRDSDIILSVLAFGKERSTIRERLQKLTQAGGGHLGFINSLDQGKEILLKEAQAIK